MPKLMVASDRLKWGRQVLLKGAPFDASEKDAKLLKKIGKAADYVQPAMPTHAAVEAPGEPAAVSSEISQLREAYFKTTGRRAFAGWDAERIRDRINAYNTRDMRAR